MKTHKKLWSHKKNFFGDSEIPERLKKKPTHKKQALCFQQQQQKK